MRFMKYCIQNSNLILTVFCWFSFQANQRRDSMDAYIVVYSVTDSNSFRYAHACLQDIRGDRFSNAVVILVANKQDLVRNKVVTEEG